MTDDMRNFIEWLLSSKHGFIYRRTWGWFDHNRKECMTRVDIDFIYNYWKNNQEGKN